MDNAVRVGEPELFLEAQVVPSDGMLSVPGRCIVKTTSNSYLTVTPTGVRYTGFDGFVAVIPLWTKWAVRFAVERDCLALDFRPSGLRVMQPLIRAHGRGQPDLLRMIAQEANRLLG